MVGLVIPSDMAYVGIREFNTGSPFAYPLIIGHHGGIGEVMVLRNASSGTTINATAEISFAYIRNNLYGGEMTI